MHGSTASTGATSRRRSGSADSAGQTPLAGEAIARQICLRQLTAAPRTRAELASAMARKRVPPEIAAAVLDRFDDVGLIDDAAFARAWVETRHAGRGLGRRMLREELRRRGVDAELAAEAVDQVSDDDEFDAARRLVRKRLPSLRTVEPPVRDRRLLGMLARRGYAAGVALRAIRAEVADAEAFDLALDDSLDDPA